MAINRTLGVQHYPARPAPYMREPWLSKPKDRVDFLLRMEDRADGNEEALLNFLHVLGIEGFGFISHYLVREKRDSGDLYMCIYVWKTKKLK